MLLLNLPEFFWSSVLETHTTFLDFSDEKAVLLSYQSVELAILASDEHLIISAPSWMGILFWCLVFCYKDVFPFRPMEKCQLLCPVQLQDD